MNGWDGFWVGWDDGFGVIGTGYPVIIGIYFLCESYLFNEFLQVSF